MGSCNLAFVLLADLSAALLALVRREPVARVKFEGSGFLRARRVLLSSLYRLFYCFFLGLLLLGGWFAGGHFSRATTFGAGWLANGSFRELAGGKLLSLPLLMLVSE